MSDKEDEAAVIAANEAFYEAFSARDVAAMDKAWAREHPVACLHPGWSPLRGRDSVMRSWRGIMQAGGSPRVRFEGARVWLLGTSAFVIGYERVQGAREVLVATNVFVREGADWRLAHHHASPVGEEADDEESPDRRTLN